MIIRIDAADRLARLGRFALVVAGFGPEELGGGIIPRAHGAEHLQGLFGPFLAIQKADERRERVKITRFFCGFIAQLLFDLGGFCAKFNRIGEGARSGQSKDESQRESAGDY